MKNIHDVLDFLRLEIEKTKLILVNNPAQRIKTIENYNELLIEKNTYKKILNYIDDKYDE
jgi:hypothetical protein